MDSRRGHTSQEKIHVLAQWLNVEPHILRFGQQGTSFQRPTFSDLDATLTPDERQIIKRYLDLPAHKRKIIGEVIKHFAIVNELSKDSVLDE